MKTPILSLLVAVGLIGSASASPLTGDLTNGLVAYYELNGNANDSVGGNNLNINNASLLHGSLFVTSIDGGALSSRNIAISGNQERTISFMFKYSDSNALNYIDIGWGDMSGVGSQSHLMAISNIEFSLWGNYGDVTTTLDEPLDFNNWNSVTLTYSNNLNEALIYINGVAQSSYTYNVNDIYNPANTLNTTSTQLLIRGNTVGDQIRGVGIWNRALSSLEVSQLYSAQVVPEPSTYALFGIGAIGMLMVIRRKKTA